jgi:SNF2 family DNA or RNA helicase
MKEEEKSTRTRVIKLLNKFGDRMIMTGTLMSKSPLNVVDQYNFLKPGYFYENMYELAELYCIMETIRTARGKRVMIGQKDYEEIRNRLKKAYARGGENALQVAKINIHKEYTISHARQEHIMRHPKYTPFINMEHLIKRIETDTVFVKREDVFDIKFDKFVNEPIMYPVEISEEAKQIANELVRIGFTDNFTLGRAAALELMTRLQDVCNGFEPISKEVNGNREITYKPFKENVKIDALLELLEEIDVETNQVVIWSSRKLLLRACRDVLTNAGVSNVVYDGDTNEKTKEEAEKRFISKEAQVFIANQASGAYGLNCLANCSYAIYLCVDGSVEKYHQSQHRILRGQLDAPKFAYAMYVKGSIEERQWEALRVGQELIGADNREDIFIFR